MNGHRVPRPALKTLLVRIPIEENVWMKEVVKEIKSNPLSAILKFVQVTAAKLKISFKWLPSRVSP